jgi:hypothetical protein
MNTFKTSLDVKAEIKRLINLDVEITDNKIYKKGGKKYIKATEKLGVLFCNKTNQLLRLNFIENVHPNGVNASVIYLN